MDPFADPMTAGGAYGFQTYSPQNPSAVGSAMSSSGAVNEAVSQVSNIGHTNNPLFWLLLLALIWTGYIFGQFEVGVKRIGKVGIEVGRE